MKRSFDIIDIFQDAVNATSQDVTLMVGGKAIACPPINYVFGSGQYVKERLSELSQVPTGNEMKFPLIALMAPFVEERNSPDYHSSASLNLLIACSTCQQWSNEQRLQTSFRNILRPIYNRLMEALREDGRIDFGYDDVIPHKYTENYSYGRYGAYTGTGDAVGEPIDAIDITDLKIIIKKQTCR